MGVSGQLVHEHDLAGDFVASERRSHVLLERVFVDAWMIRASNILDESSVIFAALPLFHTNALMVTVPAPLLKGQHVV